MRRERDVSQTILITTSMTLPDDDNPRWRLPYRAAAEGEIHRTGKYPLVAGKPLGSPREAWAGSETWDVTRDAEQRLLVG